MKSILKPEGSVMAGLATIGAVFAVYQLNVGNVATAQATPANHPVLESSRKKAGYSALVLVAGLGLVTKDANILILGCGSIIGMEIAYRHGIMAHPASGKMQSPNPNTAYAPASNVYPLDVQGETG